jgi:hypothetical protein
MPHIKFCIDVDIPMPTIPRVRRPSKWLTGPVEVCSSDEYFRVQYFQFI